MMKRILITAVWVLCLAVSGWSQTDAQQAEEMYRQGKFSAALGLYENELKKAPNNPLSLLQYR